MASDNPPKKEEEEEEEIKEEDDDVPRTTTSTAAAAAAARVTSRSTTVSNARNLDERIQAKLRGETATTTVGAVPSTTGKKYAKGQGKAGAVPSTSKPKTKPNTAATSSTTAAAAAAAAVAVGAVASTASHPSSAKASGRSELASVLARRQATQQADNLVNKQQQQQQDADEKAKAAAKQPATLAPTNTTPAPIEPLSKKKDDDDKIDKGPVTITSDSLKSETTPLTYSQQDAFDDEENPAIVSPSPGMVTPSQPVTSATMAPDSEPAAYHDNGMGSGDIIEAYVPDEILEATGVAVLMDDDEFLDKQKARYRKRALLLAVILIVISIAIIVPVVLTVAKKTETKQIPKEPTISPSAMPSLQPSMVPTSSDEPLAINTIQQYISTKAMPILQGSTLTEYMDLYRTFGTPQYDALKWILYVDDPIRPFEAANTAAWMQRLALGILYFSMIENGPWTECGADLDGTCKNSVEDDNFLHTSHECDWYTVTCNTEDVVIDLYLIGPNNLVGELPVEVGLLTELESFIWKDHSIYGTIPDAWGMLTNLEYFNVAGNELTGPWPSMLEHTPFIKNLFLFGNQLEGPIPQWIGLLKDVTWMQVGQNRFNSTVPTQIGLLKDLERLYLDDCDFSGFLPAEMTNLNKLKTLKVTNNNLQGNFPGFLANFGKLGTLSLANNSFYGPIPTNISQIGDGVPNGHTVELHDNSFAGPIIPELGNIRDLERLTLYGNNLTGAVPDQLCAESGPNALNELEVDCAINTCTCCNPTCFAQSSLDVLTENGGAEFDVDELIYWKSPDRKWTGLDYFSRTIQNSALSWYEFDDTRDSTDITDITQRVVLAAFYFATDGPNWTNQNNFLSSMDECEWGGITCVDNQVTEINLGGNGLGGIMLRELRGLPNLEVLILSNNNINGEIPRALSSLDKLLTLHLDHNNLHGTFPTELCDQNKEIRVDCANVTCMNNCCEGCT